MHRPATTTTTLALLAALAVTAPAVAQKVLFIRGADRSGGFLEASNDFQRTEQLADIDNTATFNGNHGWATYAQTLRDAGFEIEQMMEPLEPGAPATGQTTGAPLPLETMDLGQYDAIVFGSNNAAYGPPQVAAVDAYIRGGGGAIFISDANFGSSWADASDSDQPFLDLLGLTANQDNGTYVLGDQPGELLVPDHPVLDGVSSFDGEGVTPVTVNDTLPDGVDITVLATAEGNVRRNNGTPGVNNERGSTTPATDDDAVLLVGTLGEGRFAWHFDRNTFFNANGAGTNINRFDNQTLGVNLVRYAAIPEPVALAPAALGLLALKRTR